MRILQEKLKLRIRRLVGHKAQCRIYSFDQSCKIELQCIYMATATSVLSYASLPESRSATELTPFFNWSMNKRKKDLLPSCKRIGLQIPCELSNRPIPLILTNDHQFDSPLAPSNFSSLCIIVLNDYIIQLIFIQLGLRKQCFNLRLLLLSR